METALNILIFLVCASVVGVLVLGLINLARGGSGNTSQKLMRARVILQAIAILLLLLALIFFGASRG